MEDNEDKTNPMFLKITNPIYIKSLKEQFERSEKKYIKSSKKYIKEFYATFKRQK